MVATQFEIDNALMAGCAYFDTRASINRFPVPQGWVEFKHRALDSGFEAISFTDGARIEAMLPNKDIGFVNPGQEAEVKVETFPFTKYGTLHGTITQVSSDAIADEKLGLIYATRVRLAKDTLQVENKIIRMTPGMAVTVEVKTGKRRVIEYFLSPLMKVSSESLRER